MKNVIALAVLLLSVSIFTLPAQRDDGPEVLERGANFNIIKSVAEPDEELMAEMNAEEQADYLASLEGGSYTELASGLNYLNEGEWTPSVAVFENFEEGIVARQGQTKVVLSHSLNNPQGSVDLLASDGGRQRSSVFGIAYFDRLTGQSVMITQRKEGRAVLLPPNQVVYLDAFEGDVAADLRYTYEIGSFEQDVVLRENPPAPGAYGLNPETTVLEVWTEFAESPVPEIEQRVLKEGDVETRDLFVQPEIVDERLDFGAGRIVQGKAFSLAGENEERRREVPTAKRWEDLGEDGLFLIEAVDYLEVAEDLSALSEAQVNVDREPAEGRQEMMAAVQRGSLRRIVSADISEWGEALTAVVEPSETLMASAADFTQRPGYVLDYVFKSGSDSDFTFEGDETYYVSSPYELTDSAVFEGGAVIKYNAGAYIELSGDTLTFDTDMYRPVTFTSKTDGTIGQYITTHNPQHSYHPAALELSGGSSYIIKHARFRYAQIGVEVTAGGTTLEIWHSQVVDSDVVVQGVTFTTIKLYNLLVTGTYYIAEGDEGYQDLYCEHLTADGLTDLTHYWTYYVSVKNSMITDVGTDSSSSWDVDDGNYVDTASSSGLYQSAGAGNFYLADGSPHRNNASASIRPDLEDDLIKRTTFPPVVLGEGGSYALPGNTVWFPTAMRDNDGCLDRGYHYPPIDYAISDVYVPNGTTLSVKPGTAVAQFGLYGLLPRDGSTVLFSGTVENRINFFRYESAQEDPQRWDVGATGYSSSYYLLFGQGQSATAKTLKFNFTDFSLADAAYQDWLYANTGNTYQVNTLEVTNCRFYNGDAYLRGDTTHFHDIVNNLFVRGRARFYYQTDLAVVNNLFINSDLSFNRASGATYWEAANNIFDNITVSDDTWNGSTMTITVSDNAYVNGSPWIRGSQQAGEVTISSIAYESGHFGDFYIPGSTYGTYLEDEGLYSPAAWKLPQYTVEYRSSGDDVKDSGDFVDIGFHYPAADENGVPFDIEGIIGVPDYLEDANGNGSVTTGEYDPSSHPGTFWTDDTVSATAMAEWLVGSLGSVSQATFTGDSAQGGFYGGGASVNLPSLFDNGVILSTGHIADAAVFNQYYTNGVNADTPFFTEGDDSTDNCSSDQDHLECLLPSGNDDTRDAAILKFDLIPFADGTLQFDLIFASEEYPEFLSTLKNDAAAIFINNTNRLWVGTNVVSVSTVNATTNSVYFSANDPAATDFDSPLPFDGFTSTNGLPWLTTQSVSITNGVSIPIKIVIADEDDENYDSVVFIRPHIEQVECQ